MCDVRTKKFRRQSHTHIYIIYKETNEYVCVGDLASEVGAKLFAYTLHYVQRYAQSFMHKTNLTINLSFAAIERNFESAFKSMRMIKMRFWS